MLFLGRRHIVSEKTRKKIRKQEKDKILKENNDYDNRN